MPRKMILALVALGALLAAGTALATYPSRTTEWGEGSDFPVFWWANASYTFCVNTQGEESSTDVSNLTTAKNEWNYVSGGDYALTKASDCPSGSGASGAMSNSMCGGGEPNGVSEIVFVYGLAGYVGGAGTLGIACPEETDGNHSKGFDTATSKIWECDIAIEPADSLAYIGREWPLNVPMHAVRHEVGHCMALDHDCVPDGPTVMNAAGCPYSNDSEVITARDSTGARWPYRDYDGDGCTDAEEMNTLGTNPAGLGGTRDQDDPWDFYDVNGDRIISGTDEAIVKSKFGLVTGDPGYSTVYDRSGGQPDGWSGPPNGVINSIDVALVKAQVGDTCANSALRPD